MEKGEIGRGDMGRGYRQIGSFSPDGPRFEEDSGLERRVDGDMRLITSSIPETDLKGPITALYMAESIGESDPAMRQSAYLTALLGFESYIAGVGYHARNGRDGGPILPEMERYMDICTQLSDYCRSKVSYLAKAPEKAEGK